MKRYLLILSACLILPLFFHARERKLDGIYTEYKRTLLNGEDGSAYTINKKPFEPDMQFEFNGKKVTMYRGATKMENAYKIEGDTLILSMVVGKEPNTRTLFTKYVLEENKDELVLSEFKDNLDKNYYLRKFSFKKEKALNQAYLAPIPYPIFTISEEPPSFPGGTEEMKKFISEQANKSGLTEQVKVFLKLLITPEGTIQAVEVLVPQKVEYVKEAIDIIRRFPAFTPAKQGGMPVYTFYNLPVKFNL